jgi:hypothetical protein
MRLSPSNTTRPQTNTTIGGLGFIGQCPFPPPRWPMPAHHHSSAAAHIEGLPNSSWSPVLWESCRSRSRRPCHRLIYQWSKNKDTWTEWRDVGISKGGDYGSNEWWGSTKPASKTSKGAGTTIWNRIHEQNSNSESQKQHNIVLQGCDDLAHNQIDSKSGEPPNVYCFHVSQCSTQPN